MEASGFVPFTRHLFNLVPGVPAYPACAEKLTSILEVLNSIASIIPSKELE